MDAFLSGIRNWQIIYQFKHPRQLLVGSAVVRAGDVWVNLQVFIYLRVNFITPLIVHTHAADEMRVVVNGDAAGMLGNQLFDFQRAAVMVWATHCVAPSTASMSNLRAPPMRTHGIVPFSAHKATVRL
jgi:hypothetical protein